MREIKFRAWDGKKMLINPRFEFFNHGRNGRPVMMADEHENVEIMQFTGLLDKNGKEIYEGDILTNAIEETIVSVSWDVTGANWKFNEHKIFMDDGVGRGKWNLDMGYAKNCEVIGNIYENPELLK